MSEYWAHSPKGAIPAQPYSTHINEVVSLVEKYIDQFGHYGIKDRRLLLLNTLIAAVYHDLGKLDEKNQIILSGENFASSLPINHVDAGAAVLLQDEMLALLSAISVMSHHIGLPDITYECMREDDAFRDSRIKKHIDSNISNLLNIHRRLVSTIPEPVDQLPQGDMAVFLRILLSSLADADHTDTARNYSNYKEDELTIELRATDRLMSLDQYVAELHKIDDERSRLRNEMYLACKTADITDGIASCDSPVGSGKTTAVMAHLLVQAKNRGLRRIFVVLPFTNIIKQSVDVYRKALVLPGENPADVVAELHHRADFENDETRYLTALWRAPIIVTTAVAFFETLASNYPATLRRLHELPGSAVFIDEAHAVLPAKLLPITWRWINIFADEWTCYWVLASGSLNRFWEIKEISEQKRSVPEIVSSQLREKLSIFERKRVEYKSNLKSQSIDSFADWVVSRPGPRLVIVNTVQTAAVVAKSFCTTYGRDHVEHISTALTPKDREKTLDNVKRRLDDINDTDWTLIATSCVEAGVDLSFREGFRELGSLTSLLQASGRVNRSGSYNDAKIWTFCLSENGIIKKNPGVKNAAIVLKKILVDGNISITPALTTQAIEDEILLYGINPIYKKLISKENDKNFPFVNGNFKVIESDTKIAVVNDIFVKNIQNKQADWRSLQLHSVRIAQYKLNELHIPQIAEGIYHWTLKYDSFIGYMAGVLEKESYINDVLII